MNDINTDPLSQDPFYSFGINPSDRALVNPVKGLDLKPSATKKVTVPFQITVPTRVTAAQLDFKYESKSTLTDLKRVFVLAANVIVDCNTFPAALRMNIPGVAPTYINTLSLSAHAPSSLILFPGSTRGVSTNENREENALDLINRWGNLTPAMIDITHAVKSTTGGKEYVTLSSDHPIVYIVKCNMTSWLGPDVSTLETYASANMTDREIFGEIYRVPATYTLPRDVCMLGQDALKSLLQSFPAIDLTQIVVSAQPCVGENIFSKENMIGSERLSTDGPFTLQGYIEYTYISTSSNA